ncbi:hypothetical protein SAMN02745121_03882 [Nannocystis exedens]|uniref:VWFA domain-containing protein n=1 Tax=Nannocystis exedens TaxID=54 RepID=A0A1I1ZPZ8_9BACT|nr:hypothetical protein [Nannocystis exedens]PCC75391.1 hypothetical protein NAEX_08501 [Nannocystis exedens]SFE33438.1 hypothetical protein SAMN02745121_03882 [Nannocystis exedens]
MTRFRRTCILLATLSTLPACSDDGGTSSGGSTAGVTTAPTTNSTSATQTTSTTGSSNSGTDSTSEASGSNSDSDSETTAPTSTGMVDPTTSGGFPKLDVGVEETTDGATTDGEEKGCRKVDFLFIIDNSGSMSDEQQSLIASFPGFISAIQSQLDEAQDYHIMVIDTDSWVFEGCNLICPLFGNTCPVAGLDYTCGTPPLECEDVLGAGVTHPRGLQSSSKDCAFSTGFRYMDVTEPDLTATFACAAQVGTGSTDDPEKPMEAMVQAVAPSGPAFECNTGFLRKDAILVVTIVTDEDDNFGDGSAGNPAGWKASLVAAKKGDEKALVVLGLYGDNDQPNGICGPLVDSSGAEPSPRIREFVESFGDQGISGSVCAPSYDSFFSEAVGLIAQTCDDFVPPPM